MYNEYLDIFHNVYGIVFCLHILYLTCPILTHKETTEYNTNYDQIYYYSSLYFFISGIINCLDASYLFILHHIISYIAIYYGFIYRETKYIYWICQNLLSEISTIFLALNSILKVLNKKNIVRTHPIIYLYSNFIFCIVYTLIRIIYLLPINLKYLYVNSFQTNYKYFLPIIFYFMIGLNIYWFGLIIYWFGLICKKIISKLHISKFLFVKHK